MMARKRMQRQSLTFVVVFLIAFISDIVVSGPSSPLRRRVRHHNIKVRINATGDTIVLKFLLPNAHTKLEGYILGYGSRLFSKQFIQLPENGLSFVKEFDAEPKYLIAVKPIQINEVKKYCTGKVELEKPLHLVVGPVTPSSVLLSWGDELKSSYEGNILKECLEQGHYTVRYREKSKRWNYQTCPTSDTVIDNLKPNAVYEFGVKPISKEGTGEWSKPVVHNTSNVGLTEKPIKTISTRPINPAKPLIPGPQSSTFVTRQVHRNKTQDRLPPSKNFNSKTTVAPTKTTRQDSLSSGSTLPVLSKQPNDTGVQTTPKAEVPHSPVSSSAPPSQRNITLSQRVPQRPSRPFSTSKTSTTSHIPSRTKANGLLDRGHDLSSPARSEERPSKDNQVQLSASPEENRPKQMDKLPGQDKLGPPKLRDEEFPAGTARPRQERRQETTTAAPAVNLTNYDSENSTGFSPSPASKVDSAGNKRFTAPHVIYKTNKKPEEPCSITSSLTHFPDEEANDLNVTSPPRIPPSNLTVVTVEGCPSFVILDWQKSDNETTVYQVVSTTEGPSGNVTSIVTTNQTHTAVENLKPESNYTFTVTPKNELGTGPPTDPVAFSTEAADPRVSEYVSGKNSIWSAFPFQSTSDAYSECHGRMFVKRTWYRKFVGIQLCNSLRYQIYLSDSLNGKFYNIGDLTGSGEDHCQFVDSFLDGNTGAQIPLNELPKRPGFYRAMRHEPVSFGEVGGNSRATYVGWYECGTPIPGKW
ncbi:target of Nesh-SH3 isoform X3 [Takifugu rubripes]|uniref:target of Nesh-SH3 isoform X3 n=1 Tax=Takifugu rubripes TaxID=31033 RepID=UPI0005D29A22|nr:target of Nesh-SH3-like isoform X3 [Takifugu rubripes]|eukprot:XP_011606958.1 PREDICTED: target of Nesh-SH3-like isoform X1 [Takifugu rubripes]